MITITVTSESLAKKAETVMSNEVLYNPNLSGAKYEIEDGDYNQIDGVDEYVGASLYELIFNSNDEWPS